MNNILYLESDAEDAKFFLNLLSKSYYEFHIDQVKTINEARELIISHKKDYQVIIADLMPVDSAGPEDTFMTLKSIDETIPIILLTGLIDDGVALKLIAQGAQDYLVKSELRAVHLKRVIKYAIERQKNEKDLKTANQELNKVVDFKTNLAMVSHELRSPIACVKEGLSAALESQEVTNLSNDFKEILRVSLNATERLSFMINDLLDISKIESGKLDLNIESSDLIELIKQSASLFEKQCKEKNLELKMDFPESPVIGSFDKQRIVQIFTNFFTNALKYTREGSISIQLKLESGHIEVRFSDTGYGIEKENLNKIFLKFEKFDKGNSSGSSGTGLGLAIVKKIVELHKGTISVESERGKGTTFILNFPKSS